MPHVTFDPTVQFTEFKGHTSTCMCGEPSREGLYPTIVLHGVEGSKKPQSLFASLHSIVLFL